MVRRSSSPGSQFYLGIPQYQVACALIYVGLGPDRRTKPQDFPPETAFVVYDRGVPSIPSQLFVCEGSLIFGWRSTSPQLDRTKNSAEMEFRLRLPVEDTCLSVEVNNAYKACVVVGSDLVITRMAAYLPGESNCSRSRRESGDGQSGRSRLVVTKARRSGPICRATRIFGPHAGSRWEGVFFLG